MIYYEISRVSSLDFKEFVSIVAAFHNMGAKEKETDLSRYTKEQVEAMRQAERFNPVKSLGLNFTKPFRNFPCDSFDFYTTLFSQYDKHGTLPFPGSLADQPAIIIEIFNTLKALVNEAQGKEMEKEKRRNGSRQR